MDGKRAAELREDVCYLTLKCIKCKLREGGREGRRGADTVIEQILQYINQSMWMVNSACSHTILSTFFYICVFS